MIYLDENKNEINPKDVWKYQFVNYEGENIINFITASEGYLRRLREIHCFSVINRGQLWYDTLTETQKQELKVWYQAWLDVTETKVIPEKPSWLK